jgi:hypothetical protein
LALSGTQPVPQSGDLRLRVRAEQPVKPVKAQANLIEMD